MQNLTWTVDTEEPPSLEDHEDCAEIVPEPGYIVLSD